MDWSDPAGTANALAAVTSAGVVLVCWRRRAQNPTFAVMLAFVMAGGCWWSVGLEMDVTSTNAAVAATATVMYALGPSVMVAAFMCLGISIARPQWVPRRRLVAALFIEPVLITTAAVTNPWHLLVYAGPGAAQLTGSAEWTYGPLYWADTCYSYLELAIGLGFIARAWWTASPAFRGQHLALFLAALVPIAANVVFLAGGFGNIVDPTPLSFAVTGSIMAYAIFRQDLFTFAPVARALIIDQIGDAVVVISPAGRVLDLNPAANALLRGLRPDAPAELVGASALELVGAAATATTGQETDLVVELRGGRAEFQVRSSLLVDRHRRSLGTVLVARDVTEVNAQSRRLAAAHSQLVRQVETIERLRADLVELASRDTLTGLHNRRHMVESFGLMVAAAESTGESLAVVLFDIDRFKAINDDYGHLAGDMVLVAVARQMQAQAPAGALVARWGGEEFFIALPGADAAAGFAFADDLRRRCEQGAVEVAGRMVHSTISGGVATYPGSGASVEELFHAADVTMYQAKNAGRNLVRLHPGSNPPAPASADQGHHVSSGNPLPGVCRVQAAYGLE
jgi:diguanylate cyclase (GGDEF)-like protein